jgi:hypothetical protein
VKISHNGQFEKADKAVRITRQSMLKYSGNNKSQNNLEENEVSHFQVVMRRNNEVLNGNK